MNVRHEQSFTACADLILMFLWLCNDSYSTTKVRSTLCQMTLCTRAWRRSDNLYEEIVVHFKKLSQNCRI
jgi:hypothetical protein